MLQEERYGQKSVFINEQDNLTERNVGLGLREKNMGGNIT